MPDEIRLSQRLFAGNGFISFVKASLANSLQGV